MLSTVLYYELAMKVPIPVGITVYLLTWGLGHLRCLVLKEIRLKKSFIFVPSYKITVLYIPSSLQNISLNSFTFFMSTKR